MTGIDTVQCSATGKRSILAGLGTQNFYFQDEKI